MLINLKFLKGAGSKNEVADLKTFSVVLLLLHSPQAKVAELVQLDVLLGHPQWPADSS